MIVSDIIKSLISLMANIKFNNYTPKAPEDKGIKKIVLGIFFDGTLNNEGKSYIRKEYEKKKKGLAYDKMAASKYPFIKIDADSFDNDYSNVARMYRFYNSANQQSIYIEGIGTMNGQDSDIPQSYITGTGIAGVDAKVKKGCKTAVEKMPKDQKVELVFDVFGFSRGAAAARYFIHQITKPKYKTKLGKAMPARGYLGEELKEKNIEVTSFKIRFVGLYDTVSSYGYNFDDDVDDLRLDSISHSSVKNVVQFSAAHEWRDNFNLTNIASAGYKGMEFLIPGAHADVGGCYESGQFTQIHRLAVTPARVINDRNEYNRLANKKRQSLIEAGWYLDNKQLAVGPRSNKYVSSIRLDGNRYIDNKYSFIPLQLMCELANEKQLNFKVDQLKREKNFGIPGRTESGKQHILSYVHAKLQRYVNHTKTLSPTQRNQISYKKFLDFANEKILINGYVHWSATEKTGHAPRKDNKRKIING